MSAVAETAPVIPPVVSSVTVPLVEELAADEHTVPASAEAVDAPVAEDTPAEAAAPAETKEKSRGPFAVITNRFSRAASPKPKETKAEDAAVPVEAPATVEETPAPLAAEADAPADESSGDEGVTTPKKEKKEGVFNKLKQLFSPAKPASKAEETPLSAEETPAAVDAPVSDVETAPVSETSAPVVEEAAPVPAVVEEPVAAAEPVVEDTAAPVVTEEASTEKAAAQKKEKLGRRLSARITGLLSPKKEKSKEAAELKAPVEEAPAETEAIAEEPKSEETAVAPKVEETAVAPVDPVVIPLEAAVEAPTVEDSAAVPEATEEAKKNEVPAGSLIAA